MTTPEKEKALAGATAQIEKQYGKGSIMLLGERRNVQIPVISTGNIAIDFALGIGGLPRGRVIEVYGPESSGKTTLCLHVIAEAQKLGGSVAFIDAEHALDAIYAKKIGVDTEKLLLSQPDNGEQALEITDILVRSQGVDLVVVDSVAALTPKAEIDGEMGDSHMGLQARLMSQALRKLTASISKSNAMVIFINQLRQKIGIMFGNPETTTGGNALKFYSSIRLDIRRVSSLKTDEGVTGNRVRVKVVKNKLAPPFTEAEFDLTFGEGFSQTGTLLDLAADHGIVKKSGTWYSYNDEKLGQGREAAKQYLKENSSTFNKIDQEVRKKLNIAANPSPAKAEKVAKPEKSTKADKEEKQPANIDE